MIRIAIKLSSEEIVHCSGAAWEKKFKRMAQANMDGGCGGGSREAEG